MEVLIDSDVLLEGLGRVKPVVSTKGIVPILNCFVLEVKKDHFSISASSDELTMKWEIGEDAEFIEKQQEAVDTSTVADNKEGESSSKPVRKDVLKVKEEGRVATLASRFFEVVSKLGGSYKVHLKTGDNDNLTLSCDMIDAKATLTRDSAADIVDFPGVQEPGAEEVVLPDTFGSMLKMAQVSICEVESRFDLKGLHVSIGKGSINLTSCDNKRICKTTSQIPNNSISGEFFLSREAVKEILRMKPAGLYMGPKNHLTFKNITTTLQIRLLENKFPNFDAHIAKVNEGEGKTVEVDRKTLRDAINWVSILSESFDRRIDFDISKEEIILFSELNTSKQKRRVKVNSPVQMSFGCNPTYFTDYLDSVEDDKICFFFNESINKIFFKKSGVVYIVTPKK